MVAVPSAARAEGRGSAEPEAEKDSCLLADCCGD